MKFQQPLAITDWKFAGGTFIWFRDNFVVNEFFLHFLQALISNFKILELPLSGSHLHADNVQDYEYFLHFIVHILTRSTSLPSHLNYLEYRGLVLCRIHIEQPTWCRCSLMYYWATIKFHSYNHGIDDGQCSFIFSCQRTGEDF